MTSEERKKLIDQYKDGYRVAESPVGATEAELDGQPAPGKWSAREVVHHLCDSEMTAGVARDAARKQKITAETRH